MTFLILAALAGAVANRIRGGLFPLPGDAPGRIIWGIVCGIIAWQDMYAKRRRPRKTMGQPNRSVGTMNGQKYHATKGFR